MQLDVENVQMYVLLNSNPGFSDVPDVATRRSANAKPMKCKPNSGTFSVFPISSSTKREAVGISYMMVSQEVDETVPLKSF